MSNTPFVTFIIPTIGRDTIKNTITSILCQTNSNWLAIIIIDGAKINLTINDSRFIITHLQKTGEKNYAGNVRNYGISKATTEWIAFVDDDDCITRDYVENLKEEITITPNASTIIFRMNNKELRTNILPPPGATNFEKCKVGISFSIKKEILNIYNFEPSHIEDFVLLNKIRNAGYKIVISPYITYIARDSLLDYIYNERFNRAIIN